MEPERLTIRTTPAPLSHRAAVDTRAIPALDRLEALEARLKMGRPARAERPRHRRAWIIVTVAVVVVLAAGGGALLFVASRPDLDVVGIANGAEVARHELPGLALRVHGSGDVAVQINGEAVGVDDDVDGLVVDPATMGSVVVPGTNTLEVTQTRRFGLGDRTLDWSFTYDPSGPTIMAPAEVVAPPGAEPQILRGLVTDAASLTANGQPIQLEPGGAFTVLVPSGTPSVALVATDAEGNAEPVTIPVAASATPAAYPATAGVHVSARAWADPVIHQHIVDLARAGQIDAVQLDIKDEGGEVGYTTSVPLAITVGASMGHYDATAALDELHGLGVRVIGRIVCFRDEPLATWAWNNDRHDMLVLDQTGQPLATDYGTAAFTNVANADVRQYYIDLAVEAAGLGFDEILYDYVRRPEGSLENMQFPGLESSPDVAVARFVADTDAALAPSGASFGVSVFGIAATRPRSIGQDIRLLAPHVDYVAPMVYPSHWGPGEYGVADPVRQPGDIVAASVADFQRVVAGSGAAVVPWLEDFSAGGVTYGPAEVDAQINAAMATGSPGFLLWNSGSEYTVDALVAPTTVAPTTVAPTTVAPTTVAPTTIAPTTAVTATTSAPTTTS